MGKLSAVEEVKSKVWEMFDVLRREIISLEELDIILFLLSVYKDRILVVQETLDYVPLKKVLDSELNVLNPSIPLQYLSIIDYFLPVIKNFSLKGDMELSKLLSSLDLKVLKDNFPEIFDSVLYRISQSQGKPAGVHLQPAELTRFMTSLADLESGAKIFNPFAGLGSYGVFLGNDMNYYGQEIDNKTWALGTLRLMAHNIDKDVKYFCEDSIISWPPHEKKFDLIISTPPFGMRLRNEYKELAPNLFKVEEFLIENGIRNLNNNGQLVVLMPQSFLTARRIEQKIRQHLIEEDLIDTIISLPGGILLNTGIHLAILVISKSKRWPGSVRLINAEKFVLNERSREKTLDYDRLTSLINESPNSLSFQVSDKGDESIIVDNQEVVSNNYDLSVQRYFLNEIDGIKLSEILQPVKSQRGELAENCIFIRTTDLKNDIVDFTFDSSSSKDLSSRKPSRYKILSESCLLLSVGWGALKPTVFEFKGEPIGISHEIIPFKVNEDLVDITYLINELHTDYVKEQVEAYRTGSIMPALREEGLMEVVIKVPSLHEQKAKIRGIYELSEKIKNLNKERNALVHGKKLQSFNEFASLKHTLGRPRQNILDWTDNILDFLSNEKERFPSLNNAFAEFYEIDMISALKEIKRDINFITTLLEKGENGLILSDYKKEVVSLDHINKIIQELSGNGLNFKIKKLYLEKNRLNERGVNVNKVLFKTLLDNILTNANKYAFKEKMPNNEVVIELSEVDDFLYMIIKNNGKSFPKNYNKEKFITKYSTADSVNGSGLGGYDIHRIATDFDNQDWVLTLNEDPIYKVKFEFKFPINLIN